MADRGWFYTHEPRRPTWHVEDDGPGCRSWCILRPGHDGACVWTTDEEAIERGRRTAVDIEGVIKGIARRAAGGDT